MHKNTNKFLSFFKNKSKPKTVVVLVIYLLIFGIAFLIVNLKAFKHQTPDKDPILREMENISE